MKICEKFTKYSRTKGFTLVELMLAVAISAFLIGGVLLIFISSSATSREAANLSRVQENIRFASDLMIRDIRNAGYRDRAGLSVVEAVEIDNDFATIGSSDADKKDELTIRYAGRGSCSESFQDDGFRIVSNTYSVSGDSLMCNSEPLVSGVQSIEFSFICPNSADDSCTCNVRDTDNLADSCIGVRIGLEFVNPDGGGQSRKVELIAAFRNVILSRMNFLDDLET